MQNAQQIIWRRKDLLKHMTAYKFKQLIKTGKLQRLQKGCYIYNNTKEPDNDMILAQQFYPQAVMSIFTAANFYELTTIIPHAVHITLPSSNTRYPVVPDYPSIEFFFSNDKTFSLGLESIAIEGHIIHIYNRERTVCDMFRYLSRTGIDAAIEVFKNYMQHKKYRNIDKLIAYSRSLRVYKYINQYVEVYLG